MRMRSVSEFMRACIATGMAAGLIAAPAAARVHIDGSADLVSDYRYRGVSLSDGRPALQGGVEASAQGWFAGSWASTVHNHAGPDVELDLYGGHRGTAYGLNYTLAGYLYVDPRRNSMNYVELQTLLDRDIGGVDAEIEASLAPEQTNLDRANLYLAAGLSIPLQLRGVSLHAHAGYENGSWRHKADWDFGADYQRGPLRLGAHLIGASGPDCRTFAHPVAATALVGSARVDL